MFAALGDLVGGKRAEDDKEEIGAEDDQQAESSGTAAAGGGLSFWSVASALRDSVKQRTAELAASIQETDWKKELGAFQQGVKEETEELQHKTKEVVEHLPEKTKAVVEHLKTDNAGAVIQAKAKEAQAQLQAASKSLGTLGHRLVAGTSELFDQIKDAIQNELAFDEPQGSARHMPSKRQLAAAPGAKYSRFEADVSAMQRDSSTYCDEPEDEEDYAAWLETFDLAARRPDIDALIASNTFMAELQARIVPLIVEYDAFWTRYFYRLHKLQQKHEQFVQLTQRAQNQDEEEVGWGSDDEKLASPRPEGQQEQQPAAAPAAGAAAAAAAAAPLEESAPQAPSAAEAAGSPTKSEDGVGVASTGSSVVSQISGGTPDRWTVVTSPRKGEEQAEAAATAAPAAAAAPPADSKPAEGEAPAAKAELKPKPAAAAAGGKEQAAAPAVAVPAPAKPAAAAAMPAAAAAAAGAGAAAAATAATGGEDDELSDFDLDGEDDGAAAGDDDVDEDWGDDWT